MHVFGSLAQLVEQRTFNPLVEGSNPSRHTKPTERPIFLRLAARFYRVQTAGFFEKNYLLKPHKQKAV